MKAVLQDLRFAARQVAKNKAFAATAILILGLGIGAGTAIFSAINPILFEPLPYPQASRITMIWDIFQGARSDVTFHTYRELVERARSFDSMAVLEMWQPAMTGADEPERLDGQTVSAGYFRVLGIAPVLGRDFQASDDQFKGPKNVIVSDRLWRRRFDGNPNVIGQQVKLDGDLYAVIGVMPKGFDNVLAPSVEIWSPLQYDPSHVTDYDSQEWGHHLHMIGRLRAGFSLEQARRELDVIARSPVPEFPRPRWAALQNGFIVDSLQREVTRGIKPALLAVLGAVLLLLTIACVNVTNLLLARGVQRQGEFAVRSALGAARTRLVRQLLTESLLIATLGGAFGIVVAQLVIRMLVALSPHDLPRGTAIGIDGMAFVFAVGVTTLVGIAVGLIPALHASRGNLQPGMQRGSARTTAGHDWTRRSLVVAEVALALVLLVSAGLLLHSLERLFAVDTGFETAQLLTMQVQISGRRYDDNALRSRFYDQSLEAVRHVPGVTAAAYTSLLPLSGDQYGEYGAHFEDGHGYDVFRYVVTSGYFEATGIALRRGRLLNENDKAGAPQAVLISESLAKKQFPDQDPIGKRVHVGPMNRPWYTVIGVVGNVKQTSLADNQPDAVYITPEQSWFVDDAKSLVVRTRGDPATLASPARQAIWSVDKDQPVVRVATMDDLLSASAAQRRFSLIVFQAFALLGLLLSATGIYGVLAAGVTERTREIGIRSALGASPRDIVAFVVRQGMTLSILGIAIGLAGAVAASRGIATLLFGVSQLDPATYFGVIGLLLGVATLACWVPARRAAQIDPASTLRAE
jgi:putative ABC transport system permease protein